jgi:hypothetical protein
VTGPHVALRAPQDDGGGVVGVLIRAIVLVSASLGDGSHCTLIRTTEGSHYLLLMMGILLKNVCYKGLELRTGQAWYYYPIIKPV